MIKTRVVEITPSPPGQPPVEKELGFIYLPVPIMSEPPRPLPNGNQPPPVMIKINDHKWFVVGFTWDLPEPVADTGDDEAILDGVYVLIVQDAEPILRPSGLVLAGAGALDQVRAMVPEPGGKAN